MNKGQRALIDMLSEKSLESSNFESTEFLEQAENLVMRQFGTNAARDFRKKVAEQRINAPFSAFNPKPIDRGSKLSFTLVATRTSASIAAALPAMFFGVNDRLSAFRNVMQLPAGVTLSKLEYGVDNSSVLLQTVDSLTLTFTDGTNVDKVVITCQNNPYPVLLESTKTDLLMMNGIRVSLSNAAQVDQFDQQIVIVKNAIAGNTKRDTLTPTSYKNPEQFQSGIVDIPEFISIDKETSMQFNIVPVADFKVSMNFYAGKVQKWNASDLL